MMASRMSRSTIFAMGYNRDAMGYNGYNRDAWLPDFRSGRMVDDFQIIGIILLLGETLTILVSR